MSEPTAIVTGPDGRVWAEEQTRHPSGAIIRHHVEMTPPPARVTFSRPAVAIGLALLWAGIAVGLSGHLNGANLIGGPLLMGAGGWVLVRQAVRAGVRW